MGGKRRRYESDVDSTSSRDLKQYRLGWLAPLADDDRMSGFFDLGSTQVAGKEDSVSQEGDSDKELQALLVEGGEEELSHQKLPDMDMYYGDDEMEKTSDKIESGKWDPHFRDRDLEKAEGQEISSGRYLGPTSGVHAAGRMKRRKRDESASVRGFGLTVGPCIVRRKTRRVRPRGAKWLAKFAMCLLGQSGDDTKELYAEEHLIPNANAFREWEPLPDLREGAGEATPSLKAEGTDRVPHHQCSIKIENGLI